MYVAMHVTRFGDQRQVGRQGAVLSSSCRLFVRVGTKDRIGRPRSTLQEFATLARNFARVVHFRNLVWPFGGELLDGRFWKLRPARLRQIAERQPV